MSIFGGLFGGGEDYPPLPDTSYAKDRINAVQNELKRLAAETNDRLEVVPAEQAAYVFVGKPPKNFGLAWIHDGKISNLAILAQERKINPIKRERIDDALRDAYKRSESADRFSVSIADNEYVVTPSESLEQDVHKIIDQTFS